MKIKKFKSIIAFMMNKLKYLSELPVTDYPFISLYLHVNASNFLDQAEKNRIFTKEAVQMSEKIHDFLENKVDHRAHGVAIFVCEELGVFETFQSIMPFENSYNVNSIPHLKQLTHHIEREENALLIMVDKQHARVFNVELGGFILDQMDMEHEIHRFHKQGGWAQARYQRHIDNQALHHYKEVAKVATELLDNNPYDSVILIGQHHEAKELQEHLPKRVNTKVIDTNALGMRDNINAILEKVVTDLREHRDKQEIDDVEKLIEFSPQLTSMGWQDTIQLVEEGRADTVVIPGYKTYIGWKCDGCLYIAKDQHRAGCPVCNNGIRETDLAEEVVRETLKNSGKVELVGGRAAEILEEHEGIGVKVRY